MPAKTLYNVQQFDRVGKKLVAGRQMEQPSAASAEARDGRDAMRCAEVVATLGQRGQGPLTRPREVLH